MSYPSPAPPETNGDSSPRDALGRLLRLVRKELSEVLRDRRTVITLVLMPLLLYPLLAIAFQQVAAANLLDQARLVKDKGKEESGLPEFRIGVTSEEQKKFATDVLQYGEGYRNEAIKPKKEARPSLQLYVHSDLEEELKNGRIDVALVLQGELPMTRWVWRSHTGAHGNLPASTISPLGIVAGNVIGAVIRPLLIPGGAIAGALVGDVPPPLYRNQEIKATIILVPDRALSLAAGERVEQIFFWFQQGMVARRMHVDDPYMPITLAHLERAVLKVPGAGTISLPALIPLILILMTITGAVYPAIDATAGERERGTLEMLVAAPVPRLGLLFAKYVTVVTVAMLTGVVNLVGMVVTLKFSGLEGEIIQGGLTLEVLTQVIALLLLFALFFSALLLSITSFARSFKEAQAYLIPLMLVSLGPGIIGILPGIKLEGFVIVVPLVNIVLLGRDLFEGHMDPGAALLVVGVTLMYAGAAIALAARVFGSESVLYSEQSGWTDFFRRPDEPTETAGVPAALWCLALMIPIHYVLQGTFHLLGLIQPYEQIGALLALSVLLFAGVPLLAAWMGRVRLATGFGLRWPGTVNLAAGALLGLCLWPGVLWALSLFIEERQSPVEVVEQLRILRSFAPVGVLLMVIVPAIVEELFFRGFLFSALEKACPPWLTVLLTALLFGLLHVIQGGPLGTVRFWPSTGMGLLLGWTRLASGSVWPGLVLHALHNASMELAVQDGLVSLEDEWVLGSAGALVLGCALLGWGYWRRLRRESVSVQPTGAGVS